MVANLPQVFLTADITKVTGIPEWRVMRFVQEPEYQITPSHFDAAGSGTRRVYSIEDVCQMVLAWRMLDAGLGAKTIGQILGFLREKESERLSAKLELSDSQLRGLLLAVFRTPERGKRKSFFRAEGRSAFFVFDLVEAQVEQAERPDDDLLLLSVGRTFRDLKYRLTKWQKEKGQAT